MGEDRAQQQARRRAEVILKVRAGLLSAAEAAKQLGVSRKTYYKWEQRALAAMLEGLSERAPGRPSTQPEPGIEELQRKVRELERELESKEQSEELRRLLRDATEKKE